jgi:NADH dehydrogenase
MPEVPPSLAHFAEAELRGRGLEIRVSTRVESLDAKSITLTDGDRIPSRTVVWTAGVKPIGVTGSLGLPLNEHGRIATGRTLRVEGRDNVWALGDGAAVPDPANKGKPCPPTAQHALRQGRLAANNVAAVLAGRKLKPFRYRTLGVFVDMGRHQAVATMVGVRLRGFPAWFAARTYHLAMMPGTARRIRLMVDWTVGLFFGRASAELGKLGHPEPLATYVERGEKG